MWTGRETVSIITLITSVYDSLHETSQGLYTIVRSGPVMSRLVVKLHKGVCEHPVSYSDTKFKVRGCLCTFTEFEFVLALRFEIVSTYGYHSSSLSTLSCLGNLKELEYI